MTLTIANMDLITGRELGYGTTLIDGKPEVYVIKIVVKWLITNIVSKSKADWGDNYIIHKQEDLYKIPSELICEILVSLVD